MKEQKLNTKIIVFDNGEYFKGIKGKMVRTTRHFKDAKIMNEISERDKNYLDSRSFNNSEYKVVDVEYSIKLI